MVSFPKGMFDPIMRLIHDKSVHGPVPSWKRVLVGAVCGAMGAVASNPFGTTVLHNLRIY